MLALIDQVVSVTTVPDLDFCEVDTVVARAVWLLRVEDRSIENNGQFGAVG